MIAAISALYYVNSRIDSYLGTLETAIMVRLNRWLLITASSTLRCSFREMFEIRLRRSVLSVTNISNDDTQADHG